MQIGDLITTYHAGIWKLTKIEKRFYKTISDIPSFLRDSKKVGDEFSPLYTYKKVCDFNGESKQNKVNSCDASYCAPAIEYIVKEKERIDKLEQWLNIGQE